MIFSLIIPVHNGGDILREALDAVQQCSPPPAEVIVVDDGSTDGSDRVAAEYRVRVVPIPGPSGPATARTRGAETAQGDILVFTDADVLVPSDLFLLLREDFSREEVSAVQGTFSDYCPFGNFCSVYKNLYNRYVINSLPDWIDTTFTSLTAVRRDIFFACGGFDCNISTPSVEDRTLGRNLIRYGAKILLDRRIQVVHYKELTLLGFIRNQFRRSRDLAKLLLRNRKDEQKSSSSPKSFDPKGRFGTNAPSTMARIPVAYLGMAALIASYLWSGAWPVLMICLGTYLGLAYPFTGYLVREEGLGFAFVSLPLNFLDAVVSGAGVAWGVFSFIVFGKRY
ncbi:MAG TPA: glycosyltransferase family 2 protein [bacterium]|nr:glycosyltransferase family 2 protein [bacterium]HQL61992.1 glycosyltransferase family 2 protein [bacterium]